MELDNLKARPGTPLPQQFALVLQLLPAAGNFKLPFESRFLKETETYLDQ